MVAATTVMTSVAYLKAVGPKLSGRVNVGSLRTTHGDSAVQPAFELHDLVAVRIVRPKWQNGPLPFALMRSLAALT